MTYDQTRNLQELATIHLPSCQQTTRIVTCMCGPHNPCISYNALWFAGFFPNVIVFMATGATVIIAWLCCIAGRSASEALGAPGFQLALAAVVADAVGSTIQQLIPIPEQRSSASVNEKIHVRHASIEKVESGTGTCLLLLNVLLSFEVESSSLFGSLLCLHEKHSGQFLFRF